MRSILSKLKYSQNYPPRGQRGKQLFMSPLGQEWTHWHQLSPYTFTATMETSKSISNHSIKESQAKIWNVHTPTPV